MRRFLTPLLVLAGLTLGAQTPETPRIGVYSLGLVVENSVKARRVYTELDVLGKQLESKFEAKKAEYLKGQQQLQSSSISEEGKVQLQKQQRDLEFELKKMGDDSRLELQNLEKKVVGTLKELTNPIIINLAREQKYHLILNLDQTSLVWADETWVKAFSLEVARRLDASEGGAAPAPAPKPAEKKPAAPAKKG